MTCPTCGLPYDVVPPEALAVTRASMMEIPVVMRPEPSKCSRCDFAPTEIETGVFLNS